MNDLVATSFAYAGNRCEYCHLQQKQLPFAVFHLEHVVPREHGGDDDPGNLALACYHCNSHKGPDLSGIDPVTGQVTVLLIRATQKTGTYIYLRRRSDRWGCTATECTTVRVLEMNASDRLQLRAELESLNAIS